MQNEDTNHTTHSRTNIHYKVMILKKITLLYKVQQTREWEKMLNDAAV